MVISQKMKKMQPNLFIVGFQKCGSSSLFDLLVQHPEITGTIPKETFALADSTYENYSEQNVKNTSFDWSSYIQDDNASQAKYYLEGSVCNFYQRTALEYIKSLENPKVIFIVRDPIDRFISTYSYYGSTGVYLKPGTSLQTYFELIEKKAFTKEALNYALEHGRYATYINQWEEELGAEQIHLVGLKPLQKNTESVVEQLWNFLKITPFETIEIKHKNKSRPMKYKQLNRFLVRYLGGNNLGDSFLGKAYKKWNVSKSGKPILSEKLKDTLINYYSREFDLYREFF